MLQSLYVKNYRNLEELTINSLGRVNLIAGKNNTGKTSILEAITIFASKGNVDSIVQILENRGEYFKFYPTSVSQQELSDLNVKSLSSIFFNRKCSFDESSNILINSGTNGSQLSFRFVKYTIEEEVDEDGDVFRRRKILGKEYSYLTEAAGFGFEIVYDDVGTLISTDRSLDFSLRRAKSQIQNIPNIQFVRTNNIGRDVNAALFDKVILTDIESYLIEALRIIEPRVERIAFVESNNKSRNAVVKLAGESNVVPITSMGDGINRILTIILALVNSRDGFLLIDEFENGLHYSVQDQLWEIIFKLAVDLNIQVFATTHSNDCIASFTRILNKAQNKSLGKYIRLDNANGVIKDVSFSPEELDIASDQNIEIR